jgi:hypothetical protein
MPVNRYAVPACRSIIAGIRPASASDAARHCRPAGTRPASLIFTGKKKILSFFYYLEQK